MIEICHLRKEYPNVIPLKDVNVTIKDGEIVSVIGPSGTGKTTLIRCINLLDHPTSGQIFIDGEEITARGCNVSKIRRKIGMVFQSFNLFNHLTVIENIMIPPIKLLGMSRQEAYDRGMELLRQVGMDSRAMNYPDMLSGGQIQRVAIARALAMDPEIILFDEPTSALDPAMILEVQTVIRNLAKLGKTMIIVTHEMKFAREICTRVFYMDQGGIYEDGTPEQIFDHPEKELTRRFTQHLKVYETVVTGPEFDFIGAVAEMVRYGEKNDISPMMVNKLQMTLEDLCQQLLRSRSDIHYYAEYDGAKKCISVVVRYGGEPFDPHDSDDKLTLLVLEKITKGLHYSYETCTKRPNRIDMIVE